MLLFKMKNLFLQPKNHKGRVKELRSPRLQTPAWITRRNWSGTKPWKPETNSLSRLQLVLPWTNSRPDCGKSDHAGRLQWPPHTGKPIDLTPKLGLFDWDYTVLCSGMIKRIVSHRWIYAASDLYLVGSVPYNHHRLRCQHQTNRRAH